MPPTRRRPTKEPLREPRRPSRALCHRPRPYLLTTRHVRRSLCRPRWMRVPRVWVNSPSSTGLPGRNYVLVNRIDKPPGDISSCHSRVARPAVASDGENRHRASYNRRHNEPVGRVAIIARRVRVTSRETTDGFIKTKRAFTLAVTKERLD